MMASPTLKEDKAATPTPPLASTVAAAAADGGKKLLTIEAAEAGLANLRVNKDSEDTTGEMKSPQSTRMNRQRRSTGSNRSSKESEDESQQHETEEKIKAILEQAKQEEAATGVVVQQQHPAATKEQQQPPPALPQMPMVVQQLPPHQAQLQQLQQQRPTVLPARMVQPSQRPVVLQTQVRQPPLANSPGLSVVQLPTQPIPASEIARTTKQVLLEPKISPATAAATKIAIPSTSPRCTTSIALPTQPVPMSVAAFTSSISAAVTSIVTRTMAANPAAMPLLPQQPLPQQICSVAVLNSRTPMGQGMMPPHARLPQHPLPPTPTHVGSASSPVKPQHVSLKKRLAAKAEEELQQQLLSKAKEEMAAAAAQQQSHTPPAPKEYIKPRDAFGGGAHLIKDENMFPAGMSSLQPPPPSSPSLPSPEQLAILRDQEITLLYQALIKQGNPEHIAMSLAQDMAQDRYKAAMAHIALNERPGSVGPPSGVVMDPFHPRPSPMPAHSASDFRRQTASPLVPAHAHSRMPSTNPYVHDPYDADPRRRAQSELMNPASPEPLPEFTLPCLESYPVVWQGFLGLKNDYATVQFHYVSGCQELARASLPHDPHSAMATLRIGQRMRLEAAHLSGVRSKMLQSADHCVLLALPFGKDHVDIEAQSRQLRSHFITYLQLKGAAGIVNVPGSEAANEGGYVVHVFPSCDFANETMTSIAPDLLARVAEVEHMVIIIATVFDNKGPE